MPDSIGPMRPVFFVKEEEADFARHLEKRLLELPLSSGILFVGVSVEPTTSPVDKAPTYCFWIGCHRDFEEQLMVDLVRHVFDEEIKHGLRVQVEAHRGIGRSFLEKR